MPLRVSVKWLYRGQYRRFSLTVADDGDAYLALVQRMRGMVPGFDPRPPDVYLVWTDNDGDENTIDSDPALREVLSEVVGDSDRARLTITTVDNTARRAGDVNSESDDEHVPEHREIGPGAGGAGAGVGHLHVVNGIRLVKADSGNVQSTPSARRPPPAAELSLPLLVTVEWLHQGQHYEFYLMVDDEEDAYTFLLQRMRDIVGPFDIGRPRVRVVWTGAEGDENTIDSEPALREVLSEVVRKTADDYDPPPPLLKIATVEEPESESSDEEHVRGWKTIWLDPPQSPNSDNCLVKAFKWLSQYKMWLVPNRRLKVD